MQTRFAAWLEKTAVAKGADDFQTAGPEMRAEILASCMRLRTNNDLRRAWNGVASRDHVLWDRHILQPMLELYSLTDAWLGLGYDTFPGDPSGLDSYREPIVGARGRRGIEERS
jgi:hypothetical protein